MKKKKQRGSPLKFVFATSVITFAVVWSALSVWLAVNSPLSDAATATVTGLDKFGVSSGGNIQYKSASELAKELDTYVDLGARWIRFDIAWTDIQADGPSSYNWTKYDAVISAAKARGLKILGTISYTPAWARPAGCNNDDKCAPANASDYGNFAGAVASRYSSQGVHYWEIWNEPNITTFWLPQPDANAYTQILKAGHDAIKSADPNAVVVSGGLSPAASNGTNIAPPDFLTQMYSAGAGGYFDALGHHPYCFAGTFDCPATYASWSSWSQMSATPNNLRDLMAANGDSGKPIWMTEFGAPTGGGSAAVSEAQQVTFVQNAYDLAAQYSWAGPLFWYSYQDIGTDANSVESWFGLLRPDSSQKPAYSTYKTLTHPVAQDNSGGGNSGATTTGGSGSETSQTSDKTTTGDASSSADDDDEITSQTVDKNGVKFTSQAPVQMVVSSLKIAASKSSSNRLAVSMTVATIVAGVAWFIVRHRMPPWMR